MAKKPKALENVSNRVILIGSVISAVAIFIGALTAIGVDWPLTENSPLIQQSVEFDVVHDLEIARINAEIHQANTARLEGSIESDGFLLTQFDRPDLTPGERFEKARLIRRIEKHKRELDRLDKK